MGIRTMYSAFISSVYESLRDERALVIDALLDHNVFPVCMEHFTVSSSSRFHDIEERIDVCDFVIVILGRRYGSCDEEGVSWTEREYNYAVRQEKHILALFCDEMLALRQERGRPDLTEDEKKQLAFGDRIAFARSVTPQMPVSRIIGQFLSDIDLGTCVGWVRSSRLNGRALREWQQAHRACDLGGQWYHVHLANDDGRYIRTGTVQITQTFDPEHYRTLQFEGFNFSVTYRRETGTIGEKLTQRTRWKGTYAMSEDGTVTGIFSACREFTGLFGEQTVSSGIRRGIHDFTIDVGSPGPVEAFRGVFHDEAPSPKAGMIFVFRTRAARDAFLLEQCRDQLGCLE